MTNQQHPITPPPELVQQWYNAIDDSSTSWNRQLIIRAAQWGADQELEACLADIQTMYGRDKADWLRSMRRPKPLSLKEQALAALERYEAEEWCEELTFDSSIIRRALEALPE
jgi:hypothetical protein